MELTRRPFQGVLNIVRFNWHFYLIAVVAIITAVLLKNFLPQSFHFLFWIGIATAVITTVISLLVSYYIYDRSDLYRLPWLKMYGISKPSKVLNINAGFDETSGRLVEMFPDAILKVCDFYNPQKHTEISIERARKMYAPHPNTIQVVTSNLPFEDEEFNLVNVFMAAHEVRDEEERILFFQELNRVAANNGRVVVTEHLRDTNNFLAFTFGFLHFYSKSSWIRTFSKANLTLFEKVKTTPFVTTFILINNGTAH